MGDKSNAFKSCRTGTVEKIRRLSGSRLRRRCRLSHHRLRTPPHAGETIPTAITPAQAEIILSRDLALAEAAVERLVKVPLTQGQFDALVDFVFNLGAGRLASSTLLNYLNSGKFDVAAWQLLAWDHAGGPGNRQP